MRRQALIPLEHPIQNVEKRVVFHQRFYWTPVQTKLVVLHTFMYYVYVCLYNILMGGPRFLRPERFAQVVLRGSATSHGGQAPLASSLRRPCRLYGCTLS